MRELPIMFTAENASNIRAGRKTQTRRVLKLPKWLDRMGPVLEHAWPDLLWGSTPGLHVPCSREEDGAEYPGGDAACSMGCNGFSPAYVGKPTGPDRSCHCGKRWETVQRLPNPWGFIPPRLADSPEKLEGHPVRLWIREPFAYVNAIDAEGVTYRSDMSWRSRDGTQTLRHGDVGGLISRKTRDAIERVISWRPGMFMPRWACRTFLEIEAVRAERIQDISEEDAIAEGIKREDGQFLGAFSDEAMIAAMYLSARAAFRSRWDALHAKKLSTHGWDANPWVFAVSFRVVTP